MPKLMLEGFDDDEVREIEGIVKDEPIEDDLLRNFSPKVVKIKHGLAELWVTAVGGLQGKEVRENYRIALPQYLDKHALIGAVKAHLANPTFLKPK